MDKLQELFEGAGIPAEFAQKSKVLFEASVNEAVEAKLAVEVGKIQSIAEAKLEETKAEWLKENDELMETFLNTVVLEWATKNKPALDTQIKSELVEGVLANFRTALESQGIKVPEGQSVVLENTELKLTESSAKLDELSTQLAEVTAQLLTYKKADIVAEATEGLTDVAGDRIAALAENMPFKDIESFRASVAILAEAFGAKAKDPKEPDADDKGVDAANAGKEGYDKDGKPVKEAAPDVTAPIVTPDEASKAKDKATNEAYDIVKASAEFMKSGKRI